MRIFTQKEFDSKEGMVTAIWGPSLWHSLHTISFNFSSNPTNKERKHYYRFFKSLVNILPCRYCRENYERNLKVLNYGLHVFENRETLSYFVYQIHELINKNLGKKSNLSYEDVRYRYEHFRSICIEKTGPNETINIPSIVNPSIVNPSIVNPSIVNSSIVNPSIVIEPGCITPLYGIKSKCVLLIVPRDTKCDTFNIDKKCMVKRL